MLIVGGRVIGTGLRVAAGPDDWQLWRHHRETLVSGNGSSSFEFRPSVRPPPSPAHKSAQLLAVEALREHHIVHSDIKPDNFLIVSGGSVVLSDFGLAQTPEPPLPTMDAFLQWRTSSGGTPGYLSPEALSSTRPFVSHNSDIFSLGVVFVELLGRMSGLLLWDVGVVPPEHEDTPGVWLAMRKGARQRWLMDHHWLKHVDIPKKSSERDLCEKVRPQRNPAGS